MLDLADRDDLTQHLPSLSIRQRASRDMLRIVETDRRMIMSNEIRITRRDWWRPVHRYVSVEHFLELFVRRQNTLVAPRKWDDPFENVLERVRYRRKTDGTTFPFPLRDRAYGQCWTLREDHDAAWRCYLPGRHGVQITSTIRSLYISLQHAEPSYPTMSCFIGRVAYHKKAWFSDLSRIARIYKRGGTRRHVETLLWKRDSFRWESEVRLLYLDPRNRTHGDLFRYPVDPRTLITRVTFDPRMSTDLAGVFEQLLRNKLEYPGEIIHSSLYTGPNMEISV